jgi:hypothetical protein
LLLAAGCSQPVESTPCPGAPVATLTFTGTRTAASCAQGTEPAAGANSLFPPTVRFTGTVAVSGATAALCGIAPNAEPLVGTLVADVLDVSLTTTGALLVGCNAACAVAVDQRVQGTLQRDPGGAPSGFTGTLDDVERVDPAVARATCAPCLTPCQASYALTAAQATR